MKKSELTKEEKQKLVLQLVKDTKQSIRKCTQILEANNWVLPNDDEKPKETKKKKTRKKIKTTSLIENNEDNKQEEVSTEYDDFNYYLKRCQEQINKSIDEIEVPKQLSKGFFTMKEIIAFHNANIVDSKPMEFKMLDNFNQHHKTKFNSWDSVCASKTSLSEQELIQYKDYLNWDSYLKHHKIENLTKKTQKALKEKISAAQFFATKI